MKCQVCDCSSEAAAGKWCHAHELLFASQDREIRQALSRGLDEWVKSRFDDYPEERKRRGAGLWISPEDLNRLSAAAGAIAFGQCPEGAHGLFVREFRRLIRSTYPCTP